MVRRTQRRGKIVRLDCTRVRDDLHGAGVLVQAHGLDARAFAGVSTDSRAIAPRCLFVALRGERFDAHAFVRDAVAAGAAGVVVDARAAAPDLSAACVYVVSDTLQALQALAAAAMQHTPVCTVAITGSNGKTTTKDLTFAAVRTLGPTAATSGNRNNHIGVPLTILGRPDEARYLVAEVGANHFGEIELLSRILQPQVTVITNIGHAHLEAFGSLDGVARAKSEIFAGLRDDGAAVLNADDPYLPRLRERVGHKRSVTFGFAAHADYRVVRHAAGDDEQVLEVRGTRFRLQRPGDANASNAAAAFAVASELGAGADRIAAALGAAAYTGQRSCWVSAGDVDLLDDTYNANPDSMRQAIELLRARRGRRVAVLGDMLELGPRAEALHAEIGRVVAQAGVQVFIATGAHMAAAVREAARGGVPTALHCAAMDDVLDAVRTHVRAGDVVLVKGSRGLRMERVVAALKAAVV
jgi:UDP-N-acetylmuramoyl-tripeptide--D-alanyl-D-alanine ligase